MREDCTAEPPGELIASATAWRFFRRKARSSGPAMEAMDNPPPLAGQGRPIAPDKRTTAIFGPRENQAKGIEV